MTPCPSDHDLQHLLNEDLVAADEANVVAHVESCQRCQARLENLTSSDALRASWLVPPDSQVLTERDRLTYTCRLEVPPDSGARSNRPADTEPDLTANPAHAANVPTQSDPTPIDREGPDPLATADNLTGIATEAPPTERTDPDANEPGAERADLNTERTLALSGPTPSPAPVRPNGRHTGGPTIPGYDILGKLGEGGMGIVYKARQQGLNRLVALKMIVGGQQARVDHLARFRIEAEAVARLRHPNILQIYDIGEVDDMPFVSLELLEGGDLDDRLAGTPQPGRSGAQLMATLARAVHAAHQGGIIHRDLKPSNILFNDEGIPKITDFGLAKRLESDSRQTETGQIMGTPSYMAPEQARGHTRDVGPAADTYALARSSTRS